MSKDQKDTWETNLKKTDTVTKNPILTSDHVQEIITLFKTFADARTKRIDVRDLIITAKTLGLHESYAFVFKLLEELGDGDQGRSMDVETFTKELTNRIVSMG